MLMQGGIYGACPVEGHVDDGKNVPKSILGQEPPDRCPSGAINDAHSVWC